MISQEQLIKQLRQKKSPEYSAARLGISVQEYLELKESIIEEYGSLTAIYEYEVLNESSSPTETSWDHQINLDKGTATYKGLITDHPLEPEEIEKLYKIDNKRWKLSGYWNKQVGDGKYHVSANVTQIKEGDTDNALLQQGFVDFISTMKVPEASPKIIQEKADKEAACLILPKQDAHFNKFDIMGDNNIHSRFKNILTATKKIVNKASNINHLHEIVYVVGSDQFNSEFTGLTTKGTPQQNILTYEGAFGEICQHEIDVINYLAAHTDKLVISFVPGNHDQYVGWHLITWLQAYYRNDTSIKFDTSIVNRKYYKFGTSAIMLNHGDVLKFAQLAGIFPQEFRESWSKCSNFYIFTGDKHHEKSQEIQGIKIYQIPQLSNARSYWDDKHGYTTGKAEMTGFVVTFSEGLSDILKTII